MPSSSRPSPWSGCGATHALESAHERLVGGVEEDQVRPPTGIPQRREPRVQLGVEGPGPDVDDRGDLQVGATVIAYPARELGHRRQQLRWQVVDDEPAAVLDDVGRRRAPGPTHPRDDEEVVDLGDTSRGQD
jgi:hypothetical protein